MAKRKVTKRKIASKSVAGKRKAKAQAKAKTRAKDNSARPSKPPARLSKKALVVGGAVPNLRRPATGGQEFALSELSGQIVVLYFYPKDSTPGCTIEGRDFSRLLPEFHKSGAVVYGVSRDTMKSHENFKAKEGYTVELLSDEDEKLCQAFGVIKMKNMYGRQVRGIERSTFVIGKDGVLIKEWRAVKVPGHAEEVLSFVQSI